jgi:phosphoesterase RecJ-like protein
MGHKNLDGDALGSMLAMGHFCKNEFGKEPVLAFEGVIPDNLRFMSNGWWLKKAEGIKGCVFDLAILVDVADDDRQLDDEARAVFKNAKRKIKIDHHINSAENADANIIAAAGATAEIIAGIAEENGWKITPKIAEFLYAGIYTDTGGFTFDYTSPNTMRQAARIMEEGKLNHADIVRKIGQKARETFRNNIETLSRALFTDDGRIGYVAFSVKKTNDGDRPHRETAWLHQQILSVKDVEASATFKEVDDGKILVGIRSKTKPINGFVAGFGGGGHLMAAGFEMEGTLAQAVVDIIPKLQAFINKRTEYD